MIEFSRYTRLKPLGLVSIVDKDADGLFVEFKRFDNETGKELSDPERCRVDYEDLVTVKRKLETDLVVVMDLLKHDHRRDPKTGEL